MKQIDGVQIENQIFRYGSKVFQTDGGFLLKFGPNAERWIGMFPGCSWDQFYDEVMVDLNPVYFNPLALVQRFLIPTMIATLRDAEFCSKPGCTNRSDYKYCSVSCWFFDTIDTVRKAIDESDNENDTERHIAFIEQLISQFGKQVDEEQANPTQL